MPVETASDLAAFTDPGEFGVNAVILHGLSSLSVTGIIDAVTDTERPGANNSTGGPWLSGAADVALTGIQFSSLNPAAASALPEDTITVSDGPYAGAYRIRDVAREGDWTIMGLNRA